MKKNTFKPTIFQKTLNIYELGDTYTSGNADYRRIHKWYERTRKKISLFYQQKELRTDRKNIEDILCYLLVIFLKTYESVNLDKHAKATWNFTPFLSACFHNVLPPAETKTGKRYKKTITSDEVSFFLRFFKPDSEITQKLGYQLTKEQNEGIEHLIANTTLTPEDKFQKLMLLFYRKN